MAAREIRIYRSTSAQWICVLWVSILALCAPANAQRIINLGALTPSEGYRFDGVAPGDAAGYGVTQIGDMNGDGLADIAIGVPGGDPGGVTNAGSAVVIFGRRDGFPFATSLGSVDGQNGFRIDGVRGASLDGELGRRLRPAGDLNDDGLSDLLINAYGTSEAYVVFGSRTPFPAAVDVAALDGTRGFRIRGSLASYAAYGVSGGFDLNHDGIDDVAIGYSFADPNGIEDAGQVFVLYGRRGAFKPLVDALAFDGTDGLRIEGAQANGHTGDCIADGNDVNGDGIDDLLIGSPGADAGYVLYGRDGTFPAVLSLGSLDGSNGFRLQATTFMVLGFSAAGLGDINGDGIDDLAFGAPYALSIDDPNDVRWRGSTFVVFGTKLPRSASIDVQSLDGTNGARLDGSPFGESSGGEVSGIGDFNADGLDDYAIHSLDSLPAASVYVLFGRHGPLPPRIDLSAITETQGLKIRAAARDLAGRGLARAGDFNLDGGQDILIGSPGATVNGITRAGAGAAYVLFGTSTRLFSDGFEPSKD